MVYYRVEPIEILYDGKRSNGRHFAKVIVHEYEKMPLSHQKEEQKPTKTQTLEVILSGPGKCKAEKKVRRQLYARQMTPLL